MFTLINALAIIAFANQAAANPAPLSTNADATQLMFKLNPRMSFINGCAPLSRYDANGLISYPSNVPYDALVKNCKDISSAQVYSRHDATTGWYVYAWFGVVDQPSNKAFDYVWQFMAVLPKPGQESLVMSPGETKAIWTAVDGYREDFEDYIGHPWVNQLRPNDDSAAGMSTRTTNDKLTSSGDVLPLIDVKTVSGSWTGAAAGALSVDLGCPLSDILFPKTIATIQQHKSGVGYPHIGGVPITIIG